MLEAPDGVFRRKPMKKRKANPESAGDVPVSASRRRFMQTTAATALLAAGSGMLTKYSYAATGRPIKVGYVTPKTGSVSSFAAADDFVLGGVRKAIGNGVVIKGVTHPVEFIVRDTRSDPNRAAEVAASLIKTDKVDLLVGTMVPETTNPVADQAEINGVPCITAGTPWQAYFFGRNGNPAKGFEWTYHFCWGLEDVITSYLGMWNSIPNNKVVGALWGNDGDGNAFADREHGLPPSILQAGFKLIDPGRFDPMTNDFSSWISNFKQQNVEIVTGVLPPAAFATFWSQAAQQGFKPKICTMAKALLFATTLDSLGDRGSGLSSEVWWTPHFPFKSSLTGQTPVQYAAAWEAQMNRQWTQPLGFQHCLFEVIVDVLKRTEDVNSRQSIMQAVRSTKLDTIMGHIEFTGQPVKNVCRTPLVGGQWLRVPGQKYKYDLVIVNNDNNKAITTQASLKPLA